MTSKRGKVASNWVLSRSRATLSINRLARRSRIHSRSRALLSVCLLPPARAATAGSGALTMSRLRKSQWPGR
jgi:hypothetical protein